jgi:hypothetical protein
MLADSGIAGKAIAGIAGSDKVTASATARAEDAIFVMSYSLVSSCAADLIG